PHGIGGGVVRRRQRDDLAVADFVGRRAARGGQCDERGRNEGTYRSRQPRARRARGPARWSDRHASFNVRAHVGVDASGRPGAHGVARCRGVRSSAPRRGRRARFCAEEESMAHHRIAVIPGDGIGKEVVPEGLRVLEAAASRYSFDLKIDTFDFASCDYYEKHGRMMPEDWKDRIGHHDAIFFGAVGWPAKVPDHISLWGSLIQFRREFDQYVSLRPCRLMPGVTSPLAGRKPGDIDFYVVRENTEGEYSSIGGRIFPGTEREVVMQET